MIKAVTIWLLLSIVIGLGIAFFQAASGLERWKLTKYIGYAAMCSIVAMSILSFIVIVF